VVKVDVSSAAAAVPTMTADSDVPAAVEDGQTATQTPAPSSKVQSCSPSPPGEEGGEVEEGEEVEEEEQEEGVR